MPTDNENGFSERQRVVLWVLWLTYGSFYFCRNNLGIALPGLQAELHYDKVQMGTVLMSLKLAYGAGQFINGQMAEHLRPRKLLAIGMLATAALNVIFGWATALYFLTFVWACNGYVQALGWPPTMRTAANWFPPSQRGRAIGVIGTGYQLCSALTFVVAGWAADRFGWRGALYVPALLITASAFHMWMFLKDSPDELGPGQKAAITGAKVRSLGHNLLLTLTNPGLWFVGVALFLLDAARYGFTDWGVKQMTEVLHVSVSGAALKYAILPLGGICGTLISGWVTDRFFAGRRVPVICALLVALGLAGLAYDRCMHLGAGTSVAILFVVGFCIYGPQVLLVGTLPVDLARGGTAAAAAGFVNFMGAIGSAAGDQVTGGLAQNYGWQFAVRFWAGCGFVAAVVIALLWIAEIKARARR